MAFQKKKTKTNTLSKAEKDRIKKILEKESVRFKRPVKMEFRFKSPSGQELLETARFSTVEDGLEYGKHHEVELKKHNSKWKMTSSRQVNLQEDSQLSAQG